MVLSRSKAKIFVKFKAKNVGDAVASARLFNEEIGEKIDFEQI